MDALKQRQDPPGDATGPGEYYAVVSEFGTWYVSGDTAARVGRTLERRWRPRWIKLVDLSGSRAWIRADSIESITESTEGQRTASRTFHFLRRRESRAQKRWDDDLD